MSNSLSEILQGIEFRRLGNLPTSVAALSVNSNELAKGALFFAIRGAKDDGHKYVKNAIQNGAAAVVVEEVVADESIPQIIVADTKTALSKAAANFYENPTNNMTIVGVTGTNGKTTTVYLLNEIFKEAGLKHGTVGTLGYSIGDERFSSNLTTPDSIQLQQIFKKMLNRGVEIAAMEVSSHALALHRVDDVHFKAAVFTNISQDHLDFHHSLDEYATTKSKLFAMIEKDGFVINNLDDNYSDLFKNAARCRLFTYSLLKTADFTWAPGVTWSNGISGEILTPNGKIEIKSRLSGQFNLKNILAATAVAVNLNIDDKIIASALSGVESVPGRLQEISHPGQLRVFIDYAHTPDAITNVLQTLREMLPTSGRLIVVFGCGGNRDRDKRPKMARAVESLADQAIVTTDNPRFEEPHDIIEDIVKGFTSGYNFKVIIDRKEAILDALKNAEQNDIIAILGKGHETYQEIRGVRYPFYDGEIEQQFYGGSND